MSEWVHETLHEGMRTSFRADRVLHRRPGGRQELILFENPLFGRMLSLDGVTQVTEADEFIYHEMLTHVPVMAHGGARSVLIIGGGDGGMLREVARHQAIERIVMVEIDKDVIEFSRSHLPGLSAGAFDDPRLELAIADGADYMREAAERFDVIIIDSTDPIGPGAALFTDEFYANARRLLAEGGVLVTQNGVPFLQGEELTATMRAFRRLFRVASCYLATVPTYIGGPMAFGFGADDPTLLQVTPESLTARWKAAAIETRYYAPDVHKAAFVLPHYVRKLVEA